MSEQEKKFYIVSLQIPEELFVYLKQRAKEECTSTSYLIRKMILKDMREEGENN